MDIRIKLTQLKNDKELITYINPYVISSITEEDNVSKVELATGKIFDIKENVDEIFKLIDKVKPVMPQQMPLELDISAIEKMIDSDDINEDEKGELKALLESQK
jgi:hypothetical protein